MGGIKSVYRKERKGQKGDELQINADETRVMGQFEKPHFQSGTHQPVATRSRFCN
jgi:hypothetical protein